MAQDDISRRMMRSIRPRKGPKLRPAPRAGKVTMDLSANTISQLDAIAARRGMSREEAARDLLCRGLDAMALAASRR